MNSVKLHIETLLSETYHSKISVNHISYTGGGCINSTAKVETNAGIFFVKWNNAKQYPGMLKAEAKGLQLLKDKIKVPEVIAHKIMDDSQYLLLEFIEGAPIEKHFWQKFGKSLAELHKHSSEQFGLDHNNYIGSLPQSNHQHEVWSEFFILERLEPQIKMARDDGKIGNSIAQKFSKLFPLLENIFPPEKPSLLHGDLWSGNYMVGNKGEPVVIDPAVYYGHREMDLGMTKLFGGFPSEFYEAYHEEFPLENDWQNRTDICNLYPLMVHVNLFGGSYAMQAENILRKF